MACKLLIYFIYIIICSAYPVKLMINSPFTTQNEQNKIRVKTNSLDT
jgi:hypothetical protein